MKKIPKFIWLDLMYRDAGNWKTSDSFWYSNDKEYSEEDLEKYLNQLMGQDSFIAYYYGLHNMAPMDNEFLPSYGDDHAFIELTGFEFEYGETQNGRPIIPEGDIYECIRTIMNPEVLKEKREAAYQFAIKQTEQSLTNLKNNWRP